MAAKKPAAAAKKPAAAKKAPAKKSAKAKPAKAAAAAKTAPKRAGKAKNAAWEQLVARALSYPEAVLDHPWGHATPKVKGKAFAFMSGEDEAEFHISVKLPQSGAAALMLPFAEPTGYGLGKSGWVSASFPTASAVPLAMLFEWLDESYRAVAPKTLVKKLDAQ